MTSFNRGEWSEIYGVLYLLLKPKLKLVDKNLDQIPNADIFFIKKIILESTVKLEYQILEDIIVIYIQGDEYNRFTRKEIDLNRKILLEKILNANGKKGAFEIPSIEDFLLNFNGGHVIKGKSKNKSDIRFIVFDSYVNENKSLTYSIKSSLGSPATILNSSNHTNFMYQVEGLNLENISVINSINSRTKLLDRINKIKSLGGDIKFVKVCSDILDYNLKMIDSNLPDYLANTLLYSYMENDKELKSIFLKSNKFADETLGLKKLGDFLTGISFGFFPSIKWDGKKTVTGGLLIVTNNGEVFTLDLIYHNEEVTNYIINESKLDSPSSTRYNMLELYLIGNKIFFTLNLQVRYRK